MKKCQSVQNAILSDNFTEMRKLIGSFPFKKVMAACALKSAGEYVIFYLRKAPDDAKTIRMVNSILGCPGDKRMKKCYNIYAIDSQAYKNNRNNGFFHKFVFRKNHASTTPLDLHPDAR